MGTPHRRNSEGGGEDMLVLNSSVARLEGRMGKLEATMGKKMDALLAMMQEIRQQPEPEPQPQPRQPREP